MRRPLRWQTLAAYVPAAGFLATSGYLVNLEDNIDLLLSPGAASNALSLPDSTILSMAEAFIYLYFG
ncbi:MAG: hypothetical protein ABIG44_02685 [Planctomycetota bacterium]